ncbi:hypothetical protein [Streptomyces sp. NPDC058297]|uniref:hypothetical protein n=1 Tax=Streptomyces sp. NPDC058297 TaxID=3346433 RepID=UPI0036E54C9A
MPPRVMVSTDIGNINSVANSYLRFEEVHERTLLRVGSGAMVTSTVSFSVGSLAGQVQFGSAGWDQTVSRRRPRHAIQPP